MIRTGDLLVAYSRNYLDSKQLNDWAISLLEQGYNGKNINIAASCEELSWQDVQVYFKKILKELNITSDLDSNIDSMKQKIFLEEYKAGLRLGGELLHELDSLRKEIGFYDMIGLTIIGDDYKGKRKGGYHTLDKKLYGEALENEIRLHLVQHGKI